MLFFLLIPFYQSFAYMSIFLYAFLHFAKFIIPYPFLFTNCENLYTEGVTVNTCPGFAYGVNGCKNVYMNDTNIALKENDSRLITFTADGFHIQSCIGDVEITNSLFERTNDDILNIKSGFYMSVLRVNDEKKTVTLDRYSAENALPEKGDVLEFYNAAN